MCLAIPGKVVSISGNGFEREATIDFGGARKKANLSFTPEADIGDYVLVHVGFAISRIDESKAESIFQLVEEIDGLEDLEEAEPQAFENRTTDTS